MVRAVLPPEFRPIEAPWFRRILGVLLVFFLTILVRVLLWVWLSAPAGLCGCEHDPGHGTPPAVQTPIATPVAVPERSYENTCDGAQAYFDDLDEVTTAHFARTRTWEGTWGYFLAYYRASNPPPILEEWTGANIAFWAAISDSYASPSLSSERLEAINEAEEKLEDSCEDYEFTERFG